MEIIGGSSVKYAFVWKSLREWLRLCGEESVISATISSFGTAFSVFDKGAFFEF